MKKVLLLIGLLVIVTMLSGCMAFDHSTDHSDQFDNDSNNHSGHSHH